mmetsp:Transcript_17645/g.22692  ORF Transcript_17645/g.22692 Transcript_17645/m.22692 type:complete len:83 (+) Transcript_17645:1000-1248(+)
MKAYPPIRVVKRVKIKRVSLVFFVVKVFVMGGLELVDPEEESRSISKKTKDYIIQKFHINIIQIILMISMKFLLLFILVFPY